MRVERGASQILFGMLPGQTADLEGKIWRVSGWVDPVETGLDQEAVRNAMLAALAPWTQAGTDDGLAAQLHARTPIDVVRLNMERGVVVEPFPQQWRCKTCGRITRNRVERCRCGSTSIAQMQFVAYHTCGAAREPYVGQCPTHHAVAVRLPGTATARELHFFCPDCNRTISEGFPFQVCACGSNEGMKVTVHRAGVVFSPRYAVLVNPPDPAQAARLRAEGGGARAFTWVLDGMTEADPTSGTQTEAGLVETLRQAGISEATAVELAREAATRGEVASSEADSTVQLPDVVRGRAYEEALSLASAASDGRVRVEDMIEATTPPMRTLYEGAYLDSIRSARLSGVDLLTRFPVATLAFGYTRGDMNPGGARLVPFRERGNLRAYASVTRTEALLFRLDPMRVHAFLRSRGLPIRPAVDARDARLSILEAIDVPWPTQENPEPVGAATLTLLHSYAHRMIRRLGAYAGIEKDALAEYLIPHHLSFVVYAAARGDFVLGGLQAVFETHLNEFLDDFVGGESRCPLDPGCRSGGGACMACLHLGEPSCRWFNRFLDRKVLFGADGYLLHE